MSTTDLAGEHAGDVQSSVYTQISARFARSGIHDSRYTRHVRNPETLYATHPRGICLMRPRLPPELVGDVGHVVTQLRDAAQLRHISFGPIATLVQALPDAVRGAPCFLDRLTGLWRYEFGEPIYGDEGRVVIGTHMFTPINTLLDSLLVVSQRLGNDQASTYLGRMADRGRHQDVLAEMHPLRDVSLAVPARFEIPGAAGATIDWEIRPSDGPIVLLDVKNRILDLVRQLGSMPRDAVEVPAPDHDHRAMVRGVQHKFEPADPHERLQGVWITTVLAQREDSLAEAFGLLDPERVHFIVLNNSHREGLILARGEVDKETLYRLFGIAERTDLVFQPEELG